MIIIWLHRLRSSRPNREISSEIWRAEFDFCSLNGSFSLIMVAAHSVSPQISPLFSNTISSSTTVADQQPAACLYAFFATNRCHFFAEYLCHWPPLVVNPLTNVSNFRVFAILASSLQPAQTWHLVSTLIGRYQKYFARHTLMREIQVATGYW